MHEHSIAAVVTVLIVCGLLIAQAPATKLAATVAAVSSDVVTIKGKDGKSTMIMLDKTTKYVKDKKAATTADMKVGTSVTIEAKMDPSMNKYTAQQVDVAATASIPEGKK